MSKPDSPSKRTFVRFVATVTLVALVMLVAMATSWMGRASAHTQARRAVESGRTQVTLGNMEDALEKFNEALKLDNTNQDAYLHRANLYDEMRRYRDAVSDYTHLLELDPGNEDALFNRLFAHGCPFIGGDAG